MICFAFIDANGIPTRGGRLRQMPDGALALPEPYQVMDLPRLRYRDGHWEEREPEAEAETPPTPEEVAAWQTAMLDRARAAAIARINAETDAFRR